MTENRLSGPPGCVDRLLAWSTNRSRTRSATPIRVARLVRHICPDVERLDIIKIAGTNGKGSVCSMIDGSLRASGQRVGLFTSPHLNRLTERIRIDGHDIEADRMEAVAQSIEPILYALADPHDPNTIPSFFDIILLIALRVFLDERLDVAVVEAGIGGRDDATAVLSGSIAAITSIGLDHTEKLGHTLGDIAAEKSGIATGGSTLVVGAGIAPDTQRIIEHAVIDRRVKVVRAQPPSSGADNSPTCVARYQRDNVPTAQAVLDELSRASPGEFPPPTLAKLPGRFERFPGSPNWLLDGAHNPEGLRALRHGIQEHFPTTDRTLIFGTSGGREVDRWTEILPQIANRIVVTDDFHNAVDRHTLASVIKTSTGHVCRTVTDVDAVPASPTDFVAIDGLLIVTGSMFLVGRVRSALIRYSTTPSCAAAARAV